MSRVLFAFAMLLVFGVMKLPAEHALSFQHRSASGGQSNDIANLDLREKIGQLGFVAALSGFRAMLADFLFIRRTPHGNGPNGDGFCFCSDKSRLYSRTSRCFGIWPHGIWRGTRAQRR